VTEKKYDPLYMTYRDLRCNLCGHSA